MVKIKKMEIKFIVTRDQEKVPEKIEWNASDMQEQHCVDAVMISLWDAMENNTLRINLWTRNMLKEEMKMFYHQSLLSMADNFERATGNLEAAQAMRNFAQKLGEKMNLVMENKFTNLENL